MGIFNIFNKRSDNGSKLSVSLPVIEPAEAKEEIKSIETPVMAPTNEERSMTQVSDLEFKPFEHTL